MTSLGKEDTAQIAVKENKIPGPDHPISIVPENAEVRVLDAGCLVARSRRAFRLDEVGYPSVLHSARRCRHVDAGADKTLQLLPIQG